MTRLSNVLATVLIALSAVPQNVAAEELTVGVAYPAFSTSPLASAKLTTLPGGLILRTGEIRFKQNDLDAQIRTLPKELWPQLKRNLFFVLEEVFVKSVINWESQRWASKTKNAPQDQDSMVRAYLESLAKDVNVTDEEAKAFFEANKEAVGASDYEQVKNQIRNFLVEQKQSELVEARINGLSERYDVEIDAAWLAKQHSAAMDNPVDRARKSGRPSFVDFGADGCKPCELMAPIIEELKKEYKDKVNIVYVHVRKEQILAARYGIRAIPVQIFFDKEGKEVFRHAGFLSKEDITAKLEEMGVK